MTKRVFFCTINAHTYICWQLTTVWITKRNLVTQVNYSTLLRIAIMFVRIGRRRRCRRYCQSGTRGRCLCGDQTACVPCGPSTQWCLTRRLSIVASPSREAAAADPVKLPTRHSTTVNLHFYSSATTTAINRHQRIINNKKNKGITFISALDHLA